MSHIFPATDPVPLLVIVFFGANDAAGPEDRFSVPISEFEANLTEMVKRLQALGTEESSAPHVLIVTQPPVVDPQWNSLGGRTNLSAGRYAATAVSVSGKTGVPVVDLWKKMQQEPAWQRFSQDGLHLSFEGNKFVANAMLRAIEEHFPALQVVPCPRTMLYAGSGAKSMLPVELPWSDELTLPEYKKDFACLQR